MARTAIPAGDSGVTGGLSRGFPADDNGVGAADRHDEYGADPVVVAVVPILEDTGASAEIREEKSGATVVVPTNLAEEGKTEQAVRADAHSHRGTPVGKQRDASAIGAIRPASA